MRKTEAILGQRYYDSITNFEGVATGIFIYLHGCRRIQLSGTNEQTKGPVEYVFDEPQLVEVETDKALEGDGRPGGPKDSPMQKAAPPR